MDCTPSCRLPKHAELIQSAATWENLPGFLSVARRICANPTNFTDRFGRHVLHVAATCGKGDLLEWLVKECKVDVGLRDVESAWTALHRSVYYGRLDCAVRLIRCGADLYACDKEDLSPLDILMLDSPYKMSSAVEARVITDHKTLMDDELDLNAGDIITNVRMSDLSISYWMGTLKGKRGFFPKDCVEVIKQDDHETQLYTWGSNTNFTLGHRDENMRQHPELVDAFSTHNNIQQVAMCKFHSAFLTGDGKVLTCGHGRGGRLGHGDEKTQLAPCMLSGIGDDKCISIAAAQDHTLLVMESGVVFSFGLNNMHQLGHSPPSMQSLVPKMVQARVWKGKQVIGVAAGKYHSAFYTHTELFTCGLNIGQLGHLKGEKYQTIPRQVSALVQKDLRLASVMCSDNATVCATDRGDIYLLQHYTCQRVINRFPELTRLQVCGGNFDVTSTPDVNKAHEKLTLTLLNAKGEVYQWRSSNCGLRKALWSLKRELFVSDIAVGKNLLIITDKGEAFMCTQSDDVIPDVKRTPSSSSLTQLGLLMGDWNRKDFIGYHAERIPMVHRGMRIFTDAKSKGFAVLQSHPSAGLGKYPKVSASRMCEDFKQLLDESTIEDSIHDVTLMADDVTQRGNQVSRILTLPAVKDITVASKYLQDIYSGAYVDESCIFQNLNKPPYENKPMIVMDFASNTQGGGEENIEPWSTRLAGWGDLDDLSTSGASDQSAKSSHRQRGKSKTKSPQKKERKRETTGLKSARPREDVDKRIRFNRLSFPHLHDVTIESEDGVNFACHKCVLVARLDYFRSMLACGWLEASSEMATLKMPLHSSVLCVVLDYLYTDDAHRIKGLQDIEFIGNVLVVADQLLIGRLKEICESHMAKMISFKNVMELLEFSCVYNALQLKETCLEFICSNLCLLLEAGHLNLLSEETIEEVSKAYREMVPNMAWRMLTPQDDHLCVIDPHPSPSKRRRTSSRKRSSRSESDGCGEVTNGPEVSESAVLDRKMNDLALEDVFENEVAPKEEDSRDPQKSTDHIATTTSRDAHDEPCVVDDEHNEVDTLGQWYRKLEGTKPTSRTRPGKTPIKKKLVERASHNTDDTPSPERKTVTPVKAWGSSSSASSPTTADLRTIMQQEQGIMRVPVSNHETPLVKRDRTSPSKQPRRSLETPSVNAPSRDSKLESEVQAGINVKWEVGGRQSQKQRKRAKSAGSEQTSVAQENGEKSPESRPNPWGLPDKTPVPVSSLRELIEQERKSQLSSVAKPSPTKSLPADVSNTSRKKLSWSVLPPEAAKVDAVQPIRTSAWGSSPKAVTSTSTSVTSTTSPSAAQFSEILQSQELEDINYTKARQKSLHQIQLEDRAIHELLEHYGGRFNACELVTVERVPSGIAAPVWNRERNLSGGKS
ncbi:inhibitor of Bruton tyrosine kinase isoform X2 [Nematostella vectensis]|uniref:inhibitor of Bruton tyrosine kinase isoform X2 n=1 Tax=Nematostella vectensis TaxID=45351 RepID=UPI0020771E11|nr:inhibitor of Bruton tyrosine kinase isoform X2 [Nematostella vectensis]